MIDHGQTKGFSFWCRQLDAAKRGDLNARNQLLEHGREATAHIDRILADAKNFSTHLEEVAKLFSPAELQILRTKDAPYTEALFEKIVAPTL